MGLITRLFDYKARVIESIISDESIAKALVSNSPNFIDLDLPTEFEKDDLVYTQVFSYVPSMSTLDEAKSYIFVSTGNTSSKKNGKDYVGGSIIVTVVCPVSPEVVKTNLGSRVGYICDKIDSMVYKSRGFGLGEVNKRITEEFTVDLESKFTGFTMKYLFTDFSF